MTVRKGHARPSFLPARILTLGTLVVVLVFPSVCAGEALPVGAPGSADYRPFNPTAYDPQDTRTTVREDRHGKLIVRIRETKRRAAIAEGEPHYCRAWIEVLRRGRAVVRRYYADIEPVGFSYGLFVPARPPAPHFRAVVKLGDYDGRLLLIRQDGKTFDLPGGWYFLSADGRYLFSEYASDASGLAVFDLTRQRLVFWSQRIPEIRQWFTARGKYVFTDQDGRVYRYDLRRHRITPARGLRIESAKKVVYDFDPRPYEDCSADLTPRRWRLPTTEETNQAWRTADRNRFLVVSADFNGDGLTDEASLAMRTDGSGLGLFVSVSGVAGYREYVLDEIADPNWIAVMGVRLAGTGTYKTACGKGYFDCKPGDPEEVTLPHPAIDYFKEGGVNSFFYWNDAQQAFVRVWMSD